MPSYQVPLQGGGSMTVNASDPAAANANVQAQGGTPAGTPTNVGGVQPGEGMGPQPTTPANNQTGANIQAGQLLLQQAQQAAYQAYLNSKLALDTDQEAYQKAAQEAATVIAQAGVTGTYQGMPTQAAIKQAADIAQQQAATMLSNANAFGTWGQPQQGQQTLAAQQQAFSQANQTAQLTGYYTPPAYSPVPPITGAAGGGASNWTAPTQDQYITARTQQLQTMGFDAQRAAQTAQSEWGQGLAQSGNVGGGLPSGISFTPPPAAPADGTSATGGQPGGPPVQTLAGNQQAFQQQIDAQKQALAQWQAQQTASQNYLTMMAGLRGPADYARYQQVLGSTPGGLKDLAAAAAGQYIPGGGATTGVQPTPVTLQNFVGSATGQQPATSDTSGQAAMNSLVAPNQMAPQTWNALTPSQQQMLLGTWESQGYTKDDAQALFNQSLPRYATQSPSSGQFKLQ
jgi:hypothetical protein